MDPTLHLQQVGRRLKPPTPPRRPRIHPPTAQAAALHSRAAGLAAAGTTQGAADRQRALAEAPDDAVLEDLCRAHWREIQAVRRRG